MVAQWLGPMPTRATCVWRDRNALLFRQDEFPQRVSQRILGNYTQFREPKIPVVCTSSTAQRCLTNAPEHQTVPEAVDSVVWGSIPSLIARSGGLPPRQGTRDDQEYGAQEEWICSPLPGASVAHQRFGNLPSAPPPTRRKLIVTYS